MYFFFGHKLALANAGAILVVGTPGEATSGGFGDHKAYMGGME